MKSFNLAQNWYQFVIIAVVSYLIGCFNFAIFISRKKNQDITKMGSGNPGTMNMAREFGLKIGVITFLCDALKGGIPAVILYFLYKDYRFIGTSVLVGDFIRYFCGFFVALGHVFPITHKFKGGKAIACTLGLFWLCLGTENAWWLLFGVFFFAFVFGYIYKSEWGAMGSLLGVTGFSIIQLVIFFFRYNGMGVNGYMVCTFMLILGMNLIAWLAHNQNLRRLFSGEEHRTSLKKMVKKKK